MDGDVFSKVRRIGRDAAAMLLVALEGGTWDPYCAELCLDRLIGAAHGLPSLPAVLRELREVNALPLLAQMRREECARRIAEAVAAASGNELDLRLRNAAQACVLGGVFDERRILIRFCMSVFDRAIVYPRGGLVDLTDVANLAGARAILQPLAEAAADELRRRPEAQRLGLSRRHARVTPETNLLEP